MPFDVLPNRLTSLPQAPQPAVAQPQVLPIGDIVAKGVEGMEKTFDLLSPLSKEERRFHMAQLVYNNQLYQKALSGDKDAIMQLHGNNILNLQRSALLQEQIKKLHDANTGGVNPLSQAGGGSTGPGSTGSSSENAAPVSKPPVRIMSPDAMSALGKGINDKSPFDLQNVPTGNATALGDVAPTYAPKPPMFTGNDYE